MSCATAEQKRGQNGAGLQLQQNITLSYLNIVLEYQADKGQAIPWHEPSLSQRSIDSNSPVKGRVTTTLHSRDIRQKKQKSLAAQEEMVSRLNVLSHLFS